MKTFWYNTSRRRSVVRSAPFLVVAVFSMAWVGTARANTGPRIDLRAIPSLRADVEQPQAPSQAAEPGGKTQSESQIYRRGELERGATPARAEELDAFEWDGIFWEDPRLWAIFLHVA